MLRRAKGILAPRLHHGGLAWRIVSASRARIRDENGVSDGLAARRFGLCSLGSNREAATHHGWWPNRFRGGRGPRTSAVCELVWIADEVSCAGWPARAVSGTDQRGDRQYRLQLRPLAHFP